MFREDEFDEGKRKIRRKILLKMKLIKAVGTMTPP